MSAQAPPVAIVAGVPEELGAVRRCLRDAHEARFDGHRATLGRISNREAVVALAGDGAVRAARGLAALLDAWPCAAVIGIGVAGGLSDDLPAGTLVAAARVHGQGGVALAPDAALLRAAERAGAVPVVAVSSGSIVATPKAKRAIGETAGEPRAVVDLESHAWAREAAARGIPWLVLRVVSDAVDEELPEFLVGCRREDGGVDRAKVAARALAVPTRLRNLLELRRRVTEAAVTLAAAVGAIMVDASRGVDQDPSREATAP